MTAMKLGQHFLIDKKKKKKFIDALDLKSDETIIEIGPGHGEITKNLKSQISNLKVFAIEKDRHLILELKKKFVTDKNIKIIEGDALKILPELTKRLKNKSYKIFGNIPFYITGYLFRVLGELKNKPSLIVFFLQKEVAQRICAIPPKMNLLAASIQFWAKPEITGYISKKDFWPMPKVDSAIIALTPIYADNKQINAEKYYKLIKVLFKQPRKTILNNLVEANKREFLRERMQKEEIIEKLVKVGINPSDRPQNLTIEQIKKSMLLTRRRF